MVIKAKSLGPKSKKKVSGVPYLPYDEFNSPDKYELISHYILGEGSTGKVYPAGRRNKYVVKEFPDDERFLDFAIELNFYSAFPHPCILKPSAWTTKGNTAYL